jgi:hypothetical protein
MSEGAYPLALYRSGTAFDWDGRPTDSCVVNDEDEHLQAADDGWRDAADYHAPPKSDPLDHDGDGHPGGSLPRRGRPPKVKVGDAD